MSQFDNTDLPHDEQHRLAFLEQNQQVLVGLIYR